MGSKRSAALAFMVVISLMLLCSAKAQGPVAPPELSPEFSPGTSPAMPPADPCDDALLNLVDCLTYVEDGSNQTVPDKNCCSEFSGLVNTHPNCLCKLLGSGTAFGLKIDTTKALTLPTACRVQTPPTSLCALLGIPVPSPLTPSSAPGPANGASGSTTIGTSPSNAPSGSKNSKSNFKATAKIVFLLGFIFTFLF
ncbi:hypothetical protein J5N97_014586 [Dioscorea zingiberensis]|uniref:Bifunctional inhibitor/plant lipid transfer protein/seed storage helical domain-containing protein n=1 Tax=Dioscorea zingiberensis TaxID=325984 RepID=A0A9D5HK77_9LILI|nr:hypothetical protein J5N97_014586 [Dioscorea zingiberensis]